MMKKSRLILLGLTVLLGAGCANSHSPNVSPADKSASNVLKSESNEFIVNNIPLDYKVSIVGFNSRFLNDLLQVQVDLQNHKQKLYELEYRIRWFDNTGFEIDHTPWLPLTINAMEFKSIQMMAHSPDAENFKFYIRAKQ